MTDSHAVKLVLLGDSGVGKTSLVSQYLSGSVPDAANPTIGAAFVTKNVVVDDQPLELLIWDTAGQEVYRGLAPMYYRGASIAIIAYDVTNPDSYGAVGFWVGELRANVEGAIAILVCGNKIDLDDRRLVDGVAAAAAAAERGCLYAEASAASGAGVARAFQAALAAYLKQRAGEQPAQRGVPLRAQTEPAPRACCR
jgi:Rab family protein